ncbi:MAG: hypothetical protein GC201_09700 [Alphaproteobacteria bacterium]|nr:hypothetical protein [Alphaproteobacteria bacterium]
MLLVLTGSRDGTCDLLFRSLRDRAFRFNIDIYQDYRVEFSAREWLIEDPTGRRITSANATCAHWWKAFNFTTESDNQYVTEEVKYIFSEIYNWFAVREMTRGNPPHFHKTKGKLMLLEVAQRHFKTPRFFAGWKFDDGTVRSWEQRAVAKSLTSGLITTDKVLYTTEVDTDRLDRSYPWFLQERVESAADVTIQLVGDRMFAFSRSRVGLKGLDWRREIFGPDHPRAPWVSRELSFDERKAVLGFAQDAGVDWGRLDLMETDEGLVFLEFNANGQWAFLDQDGSAGLLPAVVSYLVDG